MGNIKRVTTGVDNYGHVENEHRKNTNSLVDILNGAWQDWTPSVAYVGTTLPLKSQIGKYIQIGSRVLFDYMQTGGVNTGVSVTELHIPLPVTPTTGTNRQVPCAGITKILGTYAYPNCFIDLATIDTGIRVTTFTLGTGAYEVYISGNYEVP
jgi:hypothetical protein